MAKSNSKKTDELVTKQVFKKEIKRLDTRIDKLDGTVGELSGRVDKLEGRVDHLSDRVDVLSVKVEKLDQKIDDVEKRLIDKIDVTHQSMKDYTVSRIAGLESKFEARFSALENQMTLGFRNLYNLIGNFIERLDVNFADHEKRIKRLEDKVQV